MNNFARRITGRMYCDCGLPATYQLSIRIGGHTAASYDMPVRNDSLDLCASCYIVHLEMEIERLAYRYQPSPVSFSDLAAVIRRYIQLESKQAHIDQARQVLAAMQTGAWDMRREQMIRELAK